MSYAHHRNFIPAVCALLFVLWVNGWLLPALALAAVGYLCWSTFKRLEEKAAADAETARRADIQHQQTIRGDERGVYGAATPAMQEYQRVTCPTSPV